LQETGEQRRHEPDQQAGGDLPKEGRVFPAPPGDVKRHPIHRQTEKQRRRMLQAAGGIPVHGRHDQGVADAVSGEEQQPQIPFAEPEIGKQEQARGGKHREHGGRTVHRKGEVRQAVVCDDSQGKQKQ